MPRKCGLIKRFKTTGIMKKTRISMVLNIIGMSVSLMVFLVLFAQVWHDYRYNSYFEDYKNIYRLYEPLRGATAKAVGV